MFKLGWISDPYTNISRHQYWHTHTRNVYIYIYIYIHIYTFGQLITILMYTHTNTHTHTWTYICNTRRSKPVYVTHVRFYCYFIFIIIMSCRLYGFPWPSLTTSLDRSSPLVGLQGYIPYPHIAAVCMFDLVVLLLPCHMWGSIGVHHLWARPCFSSSVLHVWFV